MTITCISEIIHQWMGWCPNTPALRTAPAILVTPQATVFTAQPDGSTGGPGRIVRGIDLVSESLKTLVRNRQLLVFPFLTGLVMAFLFMAQYGLRLLSTYPYNAIDLWRWLVLTFGIELVTVFCATVLFAGLVLRLAPEEPGRPASFCNGLSRAKGYLRPLANWSVIVACAGTAVFVLIQNLGYSVFTFYPVLDQFPFNFILLPEVYSTGPIGGTYAISSAVTSTLALAGINIVLFVLTLFVVPLLVLKNRRLPEAVTGSFAFMKKVWGETAVLFLILGAGIFAVSLLSLLFRVVYGIVAPEMLLFWYPGDAWIAAAVLYMLALCALAFIASTIAGIATLDLYRYGKTGQMPGVPARQSGGNGALS